MLPAEQVLWPLMFGNWREVSHAERYNFMMVRTNSTMAGYGGAKSKTAKACI